MFFSSVNYFVFPEITRPDLTEIVFQQGFSVVNNLNKCQK